MQETKTHAPDLERIAPEVRQRTLTINELYRSIQGESSHAGRACTFVRLTGCPLRCVWCDSEFSFRGGQRLTIGTVLEQVAAIGCGLVEVTGGEPLAQPGCLPLLSALCDLGYTVLLETSGAFDVAGVDPRVVKVMDVKCPGSGEAGRNLWGNLEHLRPHDELKFVIANRGDYEWAVDVLRERGLMKSGLKQSERIIHFSPVDGSLAPALLAEWILKDALPVRFQVQLHKLLWPGQQRGV